MAASCLSKLLSTILPSKSPPPPPSHLTLPPRIPLPKTPSGRAPLVATWPPSSSRPLSSSAGIAWPSLAYSATLFFKSAFSVQVIVEDNEPDEKLIGQFKRDVLRAGVLQECKRRRFFENSREKKKRKSREAARKNRKRRYPQSKDLNQAKLEGSTRKKDDNEDDNWEYDEVQHPYD